MHELTQMVKNGKDYFTKSLVWNIIDLLPTTMIIAVVIVKLKVRYENFEPHSFIQTIHSVASLMMWIRTFYFFRLFETTSKLFYWSSLVFRLPDQNDSWFIKWYESLPLDSIHCRNRFRWGIFAIVWSKHRQRKLLRQLCDVLRVHLQNESGRQRYWSFGFYLAACDSLDFVYPLRTLHEHCDA